MLNVVLFIIALGVLLVVGFISLMIGIGIGRASSKHWIKKNCCYVCAEKWRYSSGGLIDNTDEED